MQQRITFINLDEYDHVLPISDHAGSKTPRLIKPSAIWRDRREVIQSAFESKGITSGLVPLSTDTDYTLVDNKINIMLNKESLSRLGVPDDVRLRLFINYEKLVTDIPFVAARRKIVPLPTREFCFFVGGTFERGTLAEVADKYNMDPDLDPDYSMPARKSDATSSLTSKSNVSWDK